MSVTDEQLLAGLNAYYIALHLRVTPRPTLDYYRSDQQDAMTAAIEAAREAGR